MMTDERLECIRRGSDLRVIDGAGELSACYNALADELTEAIAEIDRLKAALARMTEAYQTGEAENRLLNRAENEARKEIDRLRPLAREMELINWAFGQRLQVYEDFCLSEEPHSRWFLKVRDREELGPFETRLAALETAARGLHGPGYEEGDTDE